MQGIESVLLDIEGTVCPISFVKETLFPYALRALPQVLASQWTSAALAPYLAAFPPEARVSPETLQAHVEDLTRRDVKVAALKNLQGYLWEEGYASGAYATTLFADVVPALRQWKGRGLRLAIYSSGSVFAQKLLFAHVQTKGGDDSRTDTSTAQGNELAVSSTEDLTALFEGWFDTTNAGLKTESSSYSRIADELKANPGTILFLSDNVKEVDAAIQAGMKSTVVDRPGNAPLSGTDRERLRIVDSLDLIDIEQ